MRQNRKKQLKHIQVNNGRAAIGISQAEVIAIRGEPTSKHMSDILAFTGAAAAIVGNSGNQAPRVL